MVVRDKYLCVTALIIFITGFAGNVQAAELLCFNGTLDNPQRTPLESPLPLIQNGSCINTNRTTLIFVYGYNCTINSNVTKSILSAYIEKGGKNVLLVDWPKEAEIGNLGIALGYGKAVANSEKVGNQLTSALLTLHGAGLDLNQVHMVGHSLGAQICGIAGSGVKKSGNAIARITGLDPARLLYEGLINVPNHLDKYSAIFVDIIHSDPGGYGYAQSAGTVDFWPNYKGGPSVQPGCPNGTYPLLSNNSLCSHNLSWRLHRESIFNLDAFPAAGEPDYETWIETNGTTDNVAYMGEYVSLEARGNYYLVTNGNPPYSKGNAGTKPNGNTGG